jgi:quercetin 2,3-dioxygenase
MSEKKNRRNFLGKLALGSTAVASASLFGAFASGKKEESVTDNNEEKTMKNSIKRVRALGFQWETLDPFLFCVHHEDFYPKGNDQMGPEASLSGRQLGNDFHIKDGWRMYHGRSVPGFPGHPHRGFETLTVVRTGMVDHSDSAGGAGRYGNGDLQWMTAGKGLMHAEMFPLIKKTEVNPLELFQIWLNLPRKSKMVEPDYKMFWSEEIPHFYIGDKKAVYVEALAGSIFGKSSPTPPTNSWAADPNNHVGVFNIKVQPGASFELPAVGSGINRSIYCYQGSGIGIDDKAIPEYHAVDVDSEATVYIEAGETEAKFLILQGRPINEPVVQHGPFVMNSRQEIQEAFNDYQRTQFGGWPWERYDHVHDRSLGRFAKYSDGREEKPMGA